MPFKPGRKIESSGQGRKPRGPEETKEIDNLRPILNQTQTSSKNNPLYQFLNSLLEAISNVISELITRITALENEEKSSQSPTSDKAFDYVILSDGAIPIPDSVNDGFGNFIYIPYEP